MNFLQPLFCLFGGHSYGPIHWEKDATWYKCKFCGCKKYLYQASRDDAKWW